MYTNDTSDKAVRQAIEPNRRFIKHFHLQHTRDYAKLHGALNIVLDIIAEYINHECFSKVGMETIARRSGYTRWQVGRAIQKLIQLKKPWYIRRVRKGCTGESSLYYLNPIFFGIGKDDE